jgi:ubiquinone/menaquinone biosynthesis C-methylase UbiE
MVIDKKHYYDGKPYEILFDRALKEVRNIIVEQIEPGSLVVDIACGTGSLVFDLAEKCKSVTGVELSSKMVEHAKHRQELNGKHNANFVHGDATSLPTFKDKEFDYLTISMVLHEMPSDLRLQVLSEAKRIAKKIIIADYVVPQSFSFAGIRIRIVEFLAGIDHFRGFRDFQKNNGIDYLLSESQLSIIFKEINKNGTIRVVVAQ